MAKIPSRVSKEINEKFTKENNAFRRAIKENPKDRIEVEIGDSKQDDFFPQAKIKRWDNEVNFSLRRVKTDKNPRVRTSGDKIIYEDDDEDVVFYELGAGEVGEDGGLEVELTLKKKPATNVFTFSILSKGLKFYHQPALTQEEIDAGAFRPEEVVDSFAIYHESKGGMNRADGMEYKTGKFAHAYYPYIWDATGKKIRADKFELEEGSEISYFHVTVDQSFLDNAVYPVVVDPTFGYTSVGSSLDGFTQCTGHPFMCTPSTSRVGTEYALTEDGTLDSIHVALRYFNRDDPMDIKVFLNTKDDGGSGVHNEVANIEIANLDTTATLTFYTFAASSEVITADDYVLSVVGNVSDINFGQNHGRYVSYDAGGSGATYSENDTTLSAYTVLDEDPWTNADQATGNIYSIYATYTAASGGATNPKVKVSGTFGSYPVKVKQSGVFEDAVYKVKVSGTFQ